MVAVILAGDGCSRIGNSMLMISPESYPECEGPNIAVHVSWDATGVTQEHVTINIQQPGKPPKLWNVGSPKGEDDTGAWMTDGSTLQLVNANGTLLAMRTLETTACE